MKYQLTASIICADLLNLKEEMGLLKKGKIDRIHFDVMDGIFVPRYGLPPEILRQIHEVTDIPITVHLMVQDPEPYIEVFAKAGADAFVFHIEPIFHANRVLKNNPDIKIEIDGGVTSESAPKMIANGADILVCGNSTIFKSDERIDKKIKQLRQVIDNGL